MRLTLSSAGTYDAVIQQFITHWTNLNAARGAQGLLVLQDGYDLGGLIADQIALAAAVAAALVKDETAMTAAGARETARSLAKDNMAMWRKAVAYRLARTTYLDNLPVLPPLNGGDEAFFGPLEAAARRWEAINAATDVPHFAPPLLLSDGTTQAIFVGRVADARQKTVDVRALDETATQLRRGRDALLPPIRMHLEDYRKAVIAEYPADSEWVLTLPSLSSSSTPTPDAVKLKIVWEAAAGGWRASWNGSTNPGLQRYSVRISSGPRYRDSEARVIGDLTPDQSSFLILEAEVPAGATVWAKVYVVLQEANERGSNGVKLVR